MTEPTTHGHRRAAFAFVFVTVLLDMFAIGIIIPVLPKLVETFMGGDTARAAVIYGIFGTAWALMQFLFMPVLGTLWFAAGAPLEERRRERLLESARAALPEALAGGATAPNRHVVVVRALGHRVEPLAEGLGAVRAAWRREAWQLEATLPRVWRT